MLQRFGNSESMLAENLDDDDMMFETTFARFENLPTEQRASRRSGHKKVDDDHHRRLKTRELAEMKNNEALATRKQRTKFVMAQFKRHIEDGLHTKEELKDELDKARERQVGNRSQSNSFMRMF